MGKDSENGSASPPPRTVLSVGDRLGRFEIVGPIGAGGMADVYRARDPQLQREVAIKVLSTAFAGDPGRERRFEREARATASLNHPNVVAVHDFGVQEGVGFIVTELLQGETLRDRLLGRRLPPRTAIDYTIQIASGLAAGHDRGIVHRDIKPENVFVMSDGHIKILDFGLAKIMDVSSGDSTATVTLERVPAATVAGTPAYMSPEQARGMATDHRSDIFSLGVVLYEMLAGAAPFLRSTSGESLSAVLHEEPPELGGVAPALERIVRHCLEKSPAERFQNARDLIFALQSLGPDQLTARPSRRRLSRRTAWIALLLAAAAALAAIGYRAGQRRSMTAEAPAVVRVHRLTDFRGFEEFPAISPDGRSVAFAARVNGHSQLFVRLLAGGTPVQITKDDTDHQLPRWSHDGNSLVYFSPAVADDAEGEIWIVPALGGSARRVIESIGGGDVSRDGRLACFRLMNGRVQLVTSSLDGTDIRVIAQSIPGYHLHPRWSPDGRWIAFQRGDGVRFDIFIIPSGGGEPRRLTDDRSMIRGLAWTPDGRGIVYSSSRGTTVPYLPPLALWQVGLEGGAPRQITSAEEWYEQPDVHSRGQVSAARVRMHFDIWSFPFGTDPIANVRAGIQVTHQTGQVLTPTASPDGDRIAFLSDSGGHGNLWVMSARSGGLRQITFEEDPAVTIGVPVWSPEEGGSIAFVSSKGHVGYEFGVWLVDAEGRNLRNLAKRGLGMAWSPDGRWVYYAETSAGVLNKIRLSSGIPVRVRSEATRNVIGLHGDTLYYTVERVLLDGRPELDIRAATPENGPSRVVARIPASRVPNWQIVNPTLSPEGEWLAMPLTDGGTTNIWALSTSTGTWRQVTDFGDRATFIARRLSWSADGRSILAAVGEGDADIVLLDGLLRPR